MEAIESQNTRIKEYLLKGKSLTALDALYQFGCFRLGARIHNLKEQGLKIKSELIDITSEGKTKRVSKYSIAK
jgi:hypothetical protein